MQTVNGEEGENRRQKDMRISAIMCVGVSRKSEVEVDLGMYFE